MTSPQSPSIFESFNARALTPAQIASTFVPQEHYERLVQRRHSLLIGPRGSGKTTLLKMLQPEALESWNHPSADSYRARVDFTGVFIATDVSWGKQREALGDGNLDESTHQLLSKALFTTHVLRSVVTAMEFRLAPPPTTGLGYRRINLSNEKQESLVKKISSEWKVTPEIPSFLALRHALLSRTSELRQIANKEVLLGETDRDKRLSEISFLQLHFVDAIVNAVAFFNDAVGERDGKWAMLFDELEIAPDWIYQQVISALRSADDHILFKVAVSPVSSPLHLKILNPVGGATSLDDYDPIPLWYSDKEDSRRFCEELWGAMLSQRDISPLPPEEILGTSYSDTHRQEKALRGSAYNPESRIAAAFTELAKKDATFSEYLKKHSINVAQLHETSPEKMDRVVRKIAPIVMFRNYFLGRKSITGKALRRSRKVAEIYAGADSLFAITEGNPRWFIGIIGSLLDTCIQPNKTLRVPEADQARKVEQTASRFMARIRAIPITRPPGTSRGDVVSVDTLLTRIGNYFEEAAITDTFSPEPSLVFRVSPEMPRALRDNLDKALNAGAIIYLPDGANAAKDLLLTVSNKRFRLSYLLAPLYHLPLRTGPEVSLSRILSQGQMPDMFK